MKKNLIIIVLLLFSFSGLIIAQDDTQYKVSRILGSGEMAPGESKDFTEYIYEPLYDAYSLSLIGVQGTDANYFDVTLNSWSQAGSMITVEITISLDPSAPPGSELSFTIVYRYYFIGGNAKVNSDWTIKVTGGGSVANFTGSPTEGNAPLTVQFTDQSTGNINSWDWDFGDGQTSTDQNPLHMYQNPGTYTVSLSVEGPGGSDTETKNDYITVSSGSFGPQQVITTSASGAESVYAADLDGDGDSDVLSASSADYTIAWYANDGAGSFGDQQVITTLAGQAPSVHVVDLDGDGDLDVLSGSYFPYKITWCENDGSGSFGDQQIITTLVRGVQSVYAVDLDEDGDMDVLSASSLDNKIAWFENDGNGSFGDQQVITTSADGAQSVYAADLDGDGDADVLSASFHDNKIAWYENDGTGSFGTQQVITTSADGAQSVYAADLDGDGDPDVLSASRYENDIAWYENDGSGGFGDPQVITISVTDAKSVYAADLDGDGDPDVLSASEVDDKIAWYENDGSGSFGDQQIITTSADGARSVYAADLDGDGDADVLSASFYDNKIAWYENLMTISNHPPVVVNHIADQTLTIGTEFTRDLKATPVVFNDPDGDELTYSASSSAQNIASVSVSGSMLIVSPLSEGMATVTVTADDGKGGTASTNFEVAVSGGSFGPQQVITTSTDWAESVFAADLDGDGDMDVLSASYYDHKIAWYENDGAGNFGDQQIITTSARGASSVYAADLDGDGDLDVLSASFYDSKVTWYENDGTGHFGAQQVITTSTNGAQSVYAADLDGDGDMDVLSASYDDDKIAWYENDGNGSFGDQQIITTLADGAICVYAADLDSDGDSDVLSASYFGNKIAWYENDGSGSFGDQQVITTSTYRASSVCTADLNGDSDLDVLSASAYDNKIAWYENDGTGKFGNQQVITTSADGAQSVYTADLDGDGDQDVISASFGDDKIAWYENDGTGKFGTQQVITTSADGARSVYAAELNGDGNIDIISASVNDNKIAWYENLMTISNHVPVVANPISDTALVAGGADFTRDLNAPPAIFSDPDGDELTYSASSSAPSIANASVSGSILTVSPLSEGTATVTVIADDGKGGTASTDFEVEVRSGKVEVAFDVKVPTCTPADDVVYLAGTINFWDPGPDQTGTDGNDHDIPLTEIGNNKHQITLPFDIGDSIEYKYTRGSWETVEKGPQGEEISNRTLIIPDSNYTQHDNVANWSDITLNPNIIVTPDTLFFNVGTSNLMSRSFLSAQGNLQSTQIMPDKIFQVNSSAKMNQLSSISPPKVSLSEWDTLSNSFESYFYMLEPYQTRYEATKLIPDRSCKLEVLRFAFYNYQASEKSKDCELFVWDDNGGRPGAEIWSGNVTIAYPAETWGWIDFNIADKNIHLNEFWIGHLEKTEGAPTSIHDTLGTTGRNCYSLDGISWSLIDDDFLQQAIVSYSLSDDEAVAYLSVENTGNGDLHVSDIYCSKDWIKSISSKTFTLEPGGQKNVEIWCTAENLDDGEYIDNLKITSDDPDTPVYDVILVFNVVATSIQDNSSNVPTGFALEQNYPNPFNPTTTIQFEVPKMSHVSIKIYDVLGHKVKTLVNGKYQPGSHSEVWDGKDDKGLSMVSGAYLVRMQAGGFVRVKKMLLLK